MNNPLEIANNRIYHILEGALIEEREHYTHPETWMPQVRATLVALVAAVEKDLKDMHDIREDE
jgi:hypothetical protein